MLASFGDSARIFEDLTLCNMIDYLPYVFVREWVEIPKSREFRCFVKNKQLRGISQYYYREKYYYLDNSYNRELIKSQAEGMLEDMQELGFNLNNLVFDMVYRDNSELSLLIEVNPYSSWTDPCLFDWALDKFEEFEFKWLQSLDKISEVKDENWERAKRNGIA